jgi:hypothetical protein
MWFMLPGVVLTTATDNGGDWGKTVVISHPDSYRSRYAHMEYQFPYVNQKMREGSPIGYMGHTGSATGDHLHFQTYYNTDTGQGVDPGPIDGVAVGGFYKDSVYSNSSFNTTMRLVDNTDGSPFFKLNTVSGCPYNTQNGYDANGLGQPAAFFRHCAGTTGTPTRTGRWTPALASSTNYHIFVFIPRHDGITFTGYAKYKIYSNGVYLGFILINQQVYMNKWVRLGLFNLNINNSYVELQNDNADGQRVAYDAVMFVPDF